MRSELMAVIEDLRRRKAEGETSIYFPEETLEQLRAIAAQAQAAPETVEPPARPAAETVATPERNAMPEQRTAPDTEPAARPEPGRPRAPEPTPAASAFSIAPIPEPPQITLPSGSKRERWEWLRKRVLGCPVCAEHVRPGMQVVFGVGSIDADIFFCGEAPGADEEQQGEPFVGKAGQLLTKIIQAMGLRRDQVYIGNILNWRPEHDSPSGNRPPTTEEMAFCLPYLRAQIEVVQPKVIVALGNTAITGLLGADPSRRISRIRGTWQEFAGTPLMPTYHPSYVLRYGNNKTKREVWNDMLAVMERVGLPISDKQRGYFSE